MTPTLAELVKEWRREAAELREATGDQWVEPGVVEQCADELAAALAALEAEPALPLADVPVWCAHCEHRIERCSECGKQEWRITADPPEAEPQPAPAWLPIETAPKDGTEVILGGGDTVETGSWQHHEPATESGVEVECGVPAGWYGYVRFAPGEGQPTHWMPLPAAPRAPQEPAAPTDEQKEK
jgi:hypothetical protein